MKLSKGCTVQCLGDYVLDLSMIVPAVSHRSSINLCLMTNPSYTQQPLSIPELLISRVRSPRNLRKWCLWPPDPSAVIKF